MHASHACHVRRLTHVTPTARHGTRDASDDFKRALDVDDEVCAALVSPVVWVGLRRLGRRSDAVLRGRCPPQVSGALVAAADEVRALFEGMAGGGARVSFGAFRDKIAEAGVLGDVVVTAPASSAGGAPREVRCFF